MTGAVQVSLLGASFGGGLCAYYAAKCSSELTHLVLLNPQLNNHKRYIEAKPHWANGFLDEATARQLSEQGYVGHSPTVKYGRALLHEVFWISTVAVLEEITVPTLIVHGAKDTFVPIEASREAVTGFDQNAGWSRLTVRSTASPSTMIRSISIRRVRRGRRS